MYFKVARPGKDAKNAVADTKLKGKSKSDAGIFQKREQVQRIEKAVLFGKNSTSLI